MTILRVFYNNSSRRLKLQLIGAFVSMKYKEIRDEKGIEHAAKLMRKQGYPVEVAVLALATK